jgi:S-formylglutathione hydrolase FrmB
MALVHCNFYSQVLALNTSMTVLLPDLFPWQAQRRTKWAAPPRHRPWPTLYLLHGLSDDDTAWTRRTSLERYVEPLDLAVVMPQVHRSFYADMASGNRYWTFISEEVPAVARSYFPLSAARADNFVAGLSMGGYGAFKLALSHPDRFAAAASLSGALHMARGVVHPDPERISADELRLIFGASRRVAGSDHDLFHLAQRVADSRGPKPRLYQWCGTEDFLYADNVAFRDHAQALGLPLTYEEGPGDHDWPQWDRQIQRVLAWLTPARPPASS